MDGASKTVSLWTMHAGEVVTLKKANGGKCSIVASCHTSSAVHNRILTLARDPSVDSVALELDASRTRDAMPGSGVSVMQTPVLLVCLVLQTLYTMPLMAADSGVHDADMQAGAMVAEERGLPVTLVDRPIHVTLARIRALSIAWNMVRDAPRDAWDMCRFLAAGDAGGVADVLERGGDADEEAAVVLRRGAEIDAAAAEGRGIRGVGAAFSAGTVARSLADSSSGVIRALAKALRGTEPLDDADVEALRSGVIEAARMSLLASEVKRGCDGGPPGSAELARGIGTAPAVGGDLLFTVTTASSVRRAPRWPSDDSVLGGLGGDSALIDERDYVIAHRLNRTGGQHTVAVVGMGHVPGIVRRWGRTEEEVAAALERVPEDYVTQDWVLPAAQGGLASAAAVMAWRSGRVGKVAVGAAFVGAVGVASGAAFVMGRLTAMMGSATSRVTEAAMAERKRRRAMNA